MSVGTIVTNLKLKRKLEMKRNSGSLPLVEALVMALMERFKERNERLVFDRIYET